MCAASELPVVPLTPEDVQKLCNLARLELRHDEIGDLSAKLSDIVRLVGELQAQDTAGVAPMAHPLERPQRLRPDAVTETDARSLYQQNAPLVEEGLYLVPKVIE
jgi:aspartyl-tRNA(Asn)/glutamyl-tRNA(Gln) amidotransferase subunit C